MGNILGNLDFSDTISAEGTSSAENSSQNLKFQSKSSQSVVNCDHVILGIHAVGKHVSELSGEFALALEMGATLEDVAGTIHVHPTLTEGFAEGVLTALGHPIHISV